MKKLFTSLLLTICAVTLYGSVTFNVKVPAGTLNCYVCGSAAAIGAWSPGSAPMMNKVEGEDRFTLTIEELTSNDVAQGFKYLCEQDWAYVEKTSSGGEISNRTTAGNPDVVAKWASLPPVPYKNVFKESVKYEGKDYIFYVMVPENYDTTQDKYPVLYMAGFKQRYKNSGDDNEQADNHFNSSSWDIPKYASDGGIIVSFYGSLAELTPYKYADFEGTGNASKLQEKLTDVIMPYVNGKYRTLTDKENTSIGGGGYAGLFALYTAMDNQDIFGNCAAFSPAIWLNRSEITDYIGKWNGNDSRICLTLTNSDVEMQKTDINTIAEALSQSGATVKTYTSDGLHSDIGWASQFKEVYNWLNGNESAVKNAPEYTPVVKTQEFTQLKSGSASTVYYYMIGSSASGVVCVDGKKTNPGYFYKDGKTATPASIGMYELPVDSKTTTWYWNFNDGENCSGSKLLTDDKVCKVSVKSSRKTISWLRSVIYDDGSVSVISASNSHFRAVVAGKNDVIMSQTSVYSLTANLTFGDSKIVSIHYGSVNSGSDMGEIVNATVSAECTKATVTYNFLNNQVDVKETAWDKIPKVDMFQAVPAIVRTGGSFTVKAKLSNTEGAKSFSYRMSHNYGTTSVIAHTENPDGTHSFTIDDAKSGIYHFYIDYVNESGETVSSLSYICVKVIDGTAHNPSIVTNAYEDIDWNSVGFYKSNYHTHTTQSNDANFTTAETVDKYHNAGYKILSITDHDYNSYPWNLFGQFKEGVPTRDPEELGMIAVPGIELSKDDRNNWNERGGGSFNHHNDFYTGRHGQEFQTIEESFAYTQSLGGYIIVNHPGQYWSLDKTYKDEDRDSPAWHAKHFNDFSCLIGLEVYNQGNRRPNDRILWDQILTRTMPERPVWGYSGDDMHNKDQLFRNYQFMLMDDFSKDGLIEAFERGSNIFSYEPLGSGEAKAPRVTSINVDTQSQTITIETDATDIQWISGTDIKSGAAASTRKSSIVGRGKSFCYRGFQGSYVRALIKNAYGETCTQPFGFGVITGIEENNYEEDGNVSQITLFPNPTTGFINIYVGENIAQGTNLSIRDGLGRVLDSAMVNAPTVETNLTNLPQGVYFVNVAGKTARVIKH